MVVILLTLGFYFLYPIFLIGMNSFNITNSLLADPVYGLDNWRSAFSQPELFTAVGNTFLIFGLQLVIGFPIAIAIAWSLARARMPFTYGLEFLFWVAYLVPSISITIGWMLLMDPVLGFLNRAITWLPFVDSGPFNIFSVPGIIWVHIVGSTVPSGVILLTPAFRNMDVSLEEASRVSGSSNLRTMLRVTLPVMTPPMVVVFALRVVRMFESFETEQLLGVPFGFFVYSTKLFELARESPPQYGAATALGSITLLLVAFIIPIQRWLVSRRQYTTVTGSFKPGRVNLGPWTWLIFGAIVFVLVLLIVAPVLSLLLGSFMLRAGIFILTPTYTLDHWRFVLTDDIFLNSLKNTLWLATTAAIVSPLLFSMLAYIIVRTKWIGRVALDSLIWISAVIPGMLAGLGLLWMFVGTPFLRPLYGTLIPLIIVVIIQGNTTGVQISKAFYLQMGADLEEQARVSGAGWWTTYFKIWLRLMMPTLVLLAVMNFMYAATTTSSIILLAPRGTRTLSILALEFAAPGVGLREAAGIVSLITLFLAVGMAVTARAFGLRLGIRERRY
jgi:iron(III) transport system permease protein